MKFQILLVGIILSMLIIPVYGAESEFINEEKRIEFKEITFTWVNNTMTNDEYVDIVTKLVEDRDLILYTKFNQEELSISLPDYFNGLKTDAEYWLNGNDKTDNDYANDLELLARYGILGIDDPSRLFSSTDKSVYFANDEIFLNVDMLGYRMQQEEGFIVHSYFEGSNAGSNWIDVISVPVTLDLKDEFSFYNIGNYTIEIQYGHILNSTSFEIIPYYIEVQTDKSEYYINENIFVSGTMTNIDWSENTDVLYEIYANSSMFESGTGGTLNDDGTFNFTIHTLGNELWDNYSGQMELIVTIQNSTASTFFNYYNTPNMSNEVLYNMIIDLTDRFDSHYATHVDYNDALITQNEIILSLQEDVTVLTELINALSNRTPMDTPQIIGLVADDPHNQDDNYAFGDTITILFDSDTNMPGGNGVLRKMQINDLFTFSDYIGSAYSGKWTDASTFVITVKSVGDALITINSTTVTPALGTLILPADNNPENFSTETSPVLIGDWGIPVQ